MSFGDKAEQRTYITFCEGFGKSLMETRQLLEKTQSQVSVFPEPQSIDGTDGFKKIPQPTKLKNDWKTYRNHGH